MISVIGDQSLQNPAIGTAGGTGVAVVAKSTETKECIVTAIEQGWFDLFYDKLHVAELCAMIGASYALFSFSVFCYKAIKKIRDREVE